MTFDPDWKHRIRAGDLVVFSARAIPGNELSIQELVNGLWERGATVLTEDSHIGEGHIHASGHASRDEQRQILEAVQPETFIPIHGEARQLARHIHLASEAVPDSQCLLARDGDIVDFAAPGSAAVTGQAPFGRVAQATRAGPLVPRETILLRGQLSEGGVVTVMLLVDRSSGMLLRSPEVHGLGLVDPNGLALLRARENVRDELAQLSEYARRDPNEIREAAIRAVQRSFRKEYERRPAVQALVVEV